MLFLIGLIFVHLCSTRGVTITNPMETFAEIDCDGGGMILFDEFAHWAIKQRCAAILEAEAIAERTAAVVSPPRSRSHGRVAANLPVVAPPAPDPEALGT